MKRMILGLIVICIMVFAGSAALALDTKGYVVDPSDKEYRSALSGYKEFDIGGFMEVINNLSPAARAALIKILENQEDLDRQTVVALVTFIFGDDYKVIYKWADNEALLNFLLDVFQTYDGTILKASSVSAKATKDYIFDGTKPYEDFDAATKSSTFVSIKDVGGNNSGSGGCVAFPAAVVALFFVPALVLVKRGKK